MTRALRAAALGLFMLGGAAAADPRDALPTAAGGVTVSGNIGQPLRLSAADLAGLPHEHLDVIDDDKTKAGYDGVELHVLLERAGVQLGEAMRGPRLLDYVVVTASDGYHALFSLAELDPAFHAAKILLADRRNGIALDAKHGPFRIVVPDEARHARWVREVTAIAVEHAAAPQ